jgi:anti-sigma factor RsiW
MSDHELFRERLTLRLYGELDPEESARLDEHLLRCRSCRAFAAELAQGLGALPRELAPLGDLPAGWREGLLREAAPAKPAQGPRTLLAFAAGLAAGLCAMALLHGAGPAPALTPASGGALVVTNQAQSDRLPALAGPPGTRAPGLGYAAFGLR